MARSQRGEFAVPADVRGVPTSQELKDLLYRMLNPDPTARASMQVIWEHPWFRQDLPQRAYGINSMIVQSEDVAGWQSEDQIRDKWRQGTSRAIAAQNGLGANVI